MREYQCPKCGRKGPSLEISSSTPFALIRGLRFFAPMFLPHHSWRGFCRQQLPQHILQDATVFVIENFLRRIDPHKRAEFTNSSISAGGLHLNLFSVANLLASSAGNPTMS